MSTLEFFRVRLKSMIDLRYPLAFLASRMPREQIESDLTRCFARHDRKGRPIPGVDLFGPTLHVTSGGGIAAGRPRLPTRLMMACYS